MALRDGFVNIATGQAAKFVNSVLGNSSRGSGKERYPAPTPNKPTNPNILLYPSDISTNVRAANYILFTLFKVTPGKFKSSKTVNNIMKKGAVAGARPDANQGLVVDRDATAAAQKASNTLEFTKNLLESSQGAQSLILKSQTLTESKTTIGLYMPATVNASYNMDYADSTIGAVTEVIHSFLKQIQSGTSMSQAFQNVGPDAAPMVLHAGLGVLDRLLPGTQDLAALERGSIIVPRIEVMFKGISRRKFSFDFTFMPKSDTESDTVDDIIKTFKLGMTPEFKLQKTTREMTFPDIFGIAYMHMDTQNSYLHKIGKCFLESVDVTYGGDKFQTFNPKTKQGRRIGEGAPPTKVTMKLSFREIEIMDKQKIQDGY
jgi:hypothetical protein